MATGVRRALPQWLRRAAAVWLLPVCLLAGGCAGGRNVPDSVLAQAAQELAAGMDAPAVPGTGILSHNSEERQVPPRVRRVASVRHGDVAGAVSLSAGRAGVAASSGVTGTTLSAGPFFNVSPVASGNAGIYAAPAGQAGTPSAPALGHLNMAAGLNPAAAPPLATAVRPALLTPHTPVPALWRRLALEAQEIFGLDAALVLAVIRAESSFNATAVSSAGAEGAMQIMPRTQEELGLIDPFDPRANVYAGAQYLMEQLQRFGSVELALAAYNAGPASVERYGGIPPYPETQEYVRRVLAYWTAGRQEAAGSAESQPAQEH